MDYTIIHELPGRIRIGLTFPSRPALDGSSIEKQFSKLEGVKDASFNYRTRSLLIYYNGSYAKDAILKKVKTMPITRTRRGVKQINNLQQKKQAVVTGGVLLAAGPLMPLFLRSLITIFGAMPILKKGIQSFLNRRLNVDALDSTAVSISISRGDYLTAGIITFLLRSGEYIEEWTRQRSRESIAKLVQRPYEWAWVKRNGKEARVNIQDVKVGDFVVVRTGSSVPVDGIVVEGEAMVNQSSMTGEPLPVLKRSGLMVYAGTALEEGFLIIKTAHAGDETRVSKIIKVIEESEGLKADVQSHAVRLADRIVPYTFLLSGLTYLYTGNSLKAASVLLVDYSCAIKLSTPLTIMSAMIAASKRGVLIKGGKFIEKLAEADVFVLDKTGTLTEARPEVVDIVSFNGFSRKYILKNAACVEEHFPHPIATAVMKKAEEEGLMHKEEHADVKYVLTHGISSRMKGKRILVGSRHFIHEDNGINVGPAEPIINDFAEKGYSVLYVAIGNELGGIIATEDSLRKESRTFINTLKDSGIERIIMLTGDNYSNAKTIAGRLKIKEYHAQVFPEKKTEIIKRLRSEGYVVAMVGDGINDSPALSHADVGISMKHGADIAKEACDVLLLDGRLGGITEARNVSQHAMLRVKKNFIYVMGINTAMIGLGLLGMITPAISALMHNGTTVLVSLNSLRPYNVLARRNCIRCHKATFSPVLPRSISCTRCHRA